MSDTNRQENRESISNDTKEVTIKRQCVLCWAILPLDQFLLDKKGYDRFICLPCRKKNGL